MSGKTIDLTSQTININSDYFQVTPEGKVTCQALAVTGRESFINLNDSFIVNSLGDVLVLDDTYDMQVGSNFVVRGKNNDYNLSLYSYGIDINDIDTKYGMRLFSNNNTAYLHMKNSNYYGRYNSYGLFINSISDDEQLHALNIGFTGSNPHIMCGQSVNSTIMYEYYMQCADYRNTSTVELKNNIEMYNKKALPEILNTDIYSYNYKTDTEKKKKLGVIIGDKYNCTDIITSEDKKSVNLYSMISLSYKAIQELAEEVEELKNGKTN